MPRGMWLPERIWEPALAADLAACSIEHTVLDDYHFHAAGLADEQLRGYYLTESEGGLIALFAGEERLRYLIPFAEPEETIQYCATKRDVIRAACWFTPTMPRSSVRGPACASACKTAVGCAVFDALAANSDWLQVTTLGECIDHVPPLGKAYVPEGSYREMGPWSTLARLDSRSADEIAAAYLSGTAPATISPMPTAGTPAGTWRNFRVRYPEIDEMYCRMLQVSKPRCGGHR